MIRYDTLQYSTVRYDTIQLYNIDFASKSSSVQNVCKLIKHTATHMTHRIHSQSTLNNYDHKIYHTGSSSSLQ